MSKNENEQSYPSYKMTVYFITTPLLEQNTFFQSTTHKVSYTCI